MNRVYYEIEKFIPKIRSALLENTPDELKGVVSNRMDVFCDGDNVRIHIPCLSWEPESKDFNWSYKKEIVGLNPGAVCYCVLSDYKMIISNIPEDRYITRKIKKITDATHKSIKDFMSQTWKALLQNTPDELKDFVSNKMEVIWDGYKLRTHIPCLSWHPSFSAFDMVTTKEEILQCPHHFLMRILDKYSETIKSLPEDMYITRKRK